MSHGLEVFNAAGTKVLATKDRLAKFLKVVSITAATNTFNLSTSTYDEVFVDVAGMSDDGTWGVQSTSIWAPSRVASGGFYYSLLFAGTYNFMVWRM